MLIYIRMYLPVAQPADQPYNPLISIIIVTWNCRDYILKCLETIYHNTDVSFEVIVRDNGSSDGTIQAIQEKFPQVKLIGDGENVGFSVANNEAIKIATGQYLLLLNPDTELPPDALVEFVNAAQKYHDKALIVPTLLNDDGTVQRSIHSFPTIVGVAQKSVTGLKKLLGIQHVSADIDWVKGACLFIPRTVYRAVGKLDENLFMYGEDLDYCWRVHQAGFEIVWLPQLKVIHYGNVSGVQKWGDQRLMRTNQTLIYFWIKHFGPYYTVILLITRLVYLIFLGLRDLVKEIVGRHSPLKLERLLSSVALLHASLQVKNWPFYFSGRHQ